LRRFSDDLAESLAKADKGLAELLSKIDAYIDTNVDGPVQVAEQVIPVATPDTPEQIIFRDAGISSVIWAAGYERRYPWLHLPILNERGDIEHKHGVTAEPGVVVLGMRFQSRKGSNLIDGVGADAAALAEYLATRNDSRSAA
jgi:putative flavoprotein involved in K+ transport